MQFMRERAAQMTLSTLSKQGNVLLFFEMILITMIVIFAKCLLFEQVTYANQVATK